jgi:hypothetical protein
MSPVRKDIDPNLVAQLCTKLNTDLDGGQIVLDFITQKIQSTQEWEAMIAFYVRYFDFYFECFYVVITNFL